MSVTVLQIQYTLDQVLFVQITHFSNNSKEDHFPFPKERGKW